MPSLEELNMTPPTPRCDMEEFWPLEYLCPVCGQQLVMRVGFRGAFWGCLGFPSCRYSRQATEEETAEAVWGRPARRRPAPAAAVDREEQRDFRPADAGIHPSEESFPGPADTRPAVSDGRAAASGGDEASLRQDQEPSGRQ
ncbi:MAG: topoisomerase DNA-binding C4 zinc finger domain-containing protein [Desulfovibrionaceae bacterium]|nr:topoisomerase DNA-binding C4 zinc finger domain-containing protein [Desulfovibrionaceae bacterium]